MKVSPPSRSPQGLVQFRQYLRWAETVVDLTSLPIATLRGSDTYAKQTEAARCLCDLLRDGALLLRLAARVCEMVGVEGPPSHLLPKQQQRPTSSLSAGHKGSRATVTALQLVVECLRRLCDSRTESAPCPVPRMEELFSGSLEAIGSALCLLFHSAVALERVSLLPTMLAWYGAVARVYGLPVPRITAAVEDITAPFADGLLWVLALHNNLVEDAVVDLTSVYREPTTVVQRESNHSYAICLFEIKDIFCYYDSPEEMAKHSNAHFTLMQAFAVFQEASATPLVQVNKEALRFAFTEQLTKQYEAHCTPTPTPLMRRQRHVEEPVTVELSDTEEGPSPSSSPRREPQKVWWCRVVVQLDGKVPKLLYYQVAQRRQAIELNPESELTFGDEPLSQRKLFRIPLSSVDRVRLCPDSTSVVVECSCAVPTAPPPYNKSCAPAVTLFFAEPEAAAAFAQQPIPTGSR